MELLSLLKSSHFGKKNRNFQKVHTTVLDFHMNFTDLDNIFQNNRITTKNYCEVILDTVFNELLHCKAALRNDNQDFDSYSGKQFLNNLVRTRFFSKLNNFYCCWKIKRSCYLEIPSLKALTKKCTVVEHILSGAYLF